MESTSTLVGLHDSGGQKSSSVRARQAGGRAPDNTSTSSLINKTVRNSKAMTIWSRTWQIMTIASFVTAGWTLYFICASPEGYDGYPLGELQARMLGDILGCAHVGGGGIAMALGPFQFLNGIRRTGKSKGKGQGLYTKDEARNSLHSWLGRVSTVACVASGIGSIHIVKKSDLYDWGEWGFVALGLAWIVTATLGWAAAAWGDKPDIDSHKKWMTRNFSLTYAAVMLRWQLPLLLRCGLSLKFALSFSGWLCWVPNLIYVW